MVKPLGLTIDPEGIHIRVEEMDETNFPDSMVWISKDAKDALRIVGLDRRVLNAGFKTKEDIYEHFASSWLFHPGHFAARLAEDKYHERLEDRAPHWAPFIKEWVPGHYPDYRPMQHTTEVSQHDGTSYECVDEDLQAWYKRTRAAVRDKVFTMFPHVAAKYYTKRASWVKEREEQRLRDLITNAIPSGKDGWSTDIPHPTIMTKDLLINTPNLKPISKAEMTPPSTPPLTRSPSLTTSSLDSPTPPLFSPLDCRPSSQTKETPPVYTDPLPRIPPVPFLPHPPPPNMSAASKLACLSRWTLFDPENGTLTLATTPRDKELPVQQWTDAVYAGATDVDLVRWASEMWWCVWVRQAAVNYVGMWKKRFGKEDERVMRAGVEVEMGKREEEESLVVEASGERMEKVRGRLARLNNGFGELG
jgi:hypothetical protein